MEKSLTKEEFDEKYEDVCRGVGDLKEKYYTLFEKRFTMMRTLQGIILLAILGLYLREV